MAATAAAKPAAHSTNNSESNPGESSINSTVLLSEMDTTQACRKNAATPEVTAVQVATNVTAAQGMTHARLIWCHAEHIWPRVVKATCEQPGRP
jgi:hypothetical protein